MPITVQAHHARMGSICKRANDKQLNLSGIDPMPPAPARTDKPTRSTGQEDGKASVAPAPSDSAATTANIFAANLCLSR
jgi:hypothetical protein